jgi:hypothetical protein
MHLDRHARLAEPLHDRTGPVRRDELVVLPEVALHRGPDPGEVLVPLERRVEHHGRGDLLTGPRGQVEHEGPAHAEPGHADGVAGDRRVLEEVVDRPGQLRDRLLGVQLPGQRHGLFLVVGDAAAEQIRGQRHEPLAREPVAHVGDVVVQPPPLLDDDQAGTAAARRLDQVTVRHAPVAPEADVLVRRVLCHWPVPRLFCGSQRVQRRAR